jgi:membrane protein
MIKLEKIFRNSYPFRYLAEKSKRLILPGFRGLPLSDVLKVFFAQVKKVGLNERAQAISFSFLMAIPAGILFLCTLIPYLPVHKKITRQLLALTKDLTPNQNTSKLISSVINDFLEKPRTGLLSFGLLLALFFASNAMIGVMRTFNRSLMFERRRNVFQTRWMAIKLTSLVMFLLIGAIIMLVTQDELLKSILHVDNHTAKVLLKTLRWVVIVPLFYFSIAFIYKYAPPVRKRWRLSSPGTILATALLILTTFLFSYWVNSFGAYNKIYGSIGTILILMILVYINSVVLLVGYELNISIYNLKEISAENAQLGLPVLPYGESGISPIKRPFK